MFPAHGCNCRRMVGQSKHPLFFILVSTCWLARLFICRHARFLCSTIGPSRQLICRRSAMGPPRPEFIVHDEYHWPTSRRPSTPRCWTFEMPPDSPFWPRSRWLGDACTPPLHRGSRCQQQECPSHRPIWLLGRWKDNAAEQHPSRQYSRSTDCRVGERHGRPQHRRRRCPPQRWRCGSE